MSDNYLAQYNPKISLFAQYEIDPRLDKNQRAFAAYQGLLSAKRSHDGLFLVIGKMLKTIRDERLYEALDYEDFKQFLASEEIGFSREKAYMCIKTYEYYIEVLQLDPAKIGQMNVSRLSMMVPVLKKLDTREEMVEQIEEYAAMRHNDFIREVKKQTNTDGKPNVFWSEQMGKWMIQYFSNTSFLQDIGEFETDAVAEGKEDS